MSSQLSIICMDGNGQVSFLRVCPWRLRVTARNSHFLNNLTYVKVNEQCGKENMRHRTQIHTHFSIHNTDVYITEHTWKCVLICANSHSVARACTCSPPPPPALFPPLSIPFPLPPSSPSSHTCGGIMCNVGSHETFISNTAVRAKHNSHVIVCWRHRGRHVRPAVSENTSTHVCTHTHARTHTRVKWMARSHKANNSIPFNLSIRASLRHASVIL